MRQKIADWYDEFYEKYPGIVVLLNWLWFLILVWIAVADKNWNFLWGFIVWLVLAMVLFGSETRKSWTYERWISGIWEYLHDGVESGRGFWKNLILLSIPLFIVGSGIFGKTTNIITLDSVFGTRLVHGNQVALHLPLIENADVWKNEITFERSGAVLTSLDGKQFTAYIFVEVSSDGSITPEQLVRQYGSFANYKRAYGQGILEEFQRVAGMYTLEEISYTPGLLLEDHIGTNMGLAPYGLTWSGVIKVENLHRTNSTATQ